jgi:two-component system sensor histidine kinase PhoQ
MEARNIDRFIDHEISSRDRYRTAMDDLAHSLKTPLAVFRNALSSGHFEDQKLLRDQLDRMEKTVAHQLSRAMAARPVVVGGMDRAAPLAERLIKALRTAYVSKTLQRTTHSRRTRIALRRARLDGNVGQPARERIQVLSIEGGRRRRAGTMVRLTIDDNGPGVAEHQRVQVLARGAWRHDGSGPVSASPWRPNWHRLSRRSDDRRISARWGADHPRLPGSA